LLTVHAVSYAEPVLSERRFEQDTDTDIIEVCREFGQRRLRVLTSRPIGT
jgi:hypothetical protein